MPEIRIEGSFELLSQEEWDKYFGTQLFDAMRIDPLIFDLSGATIHDITHPRLYELIKEHNNKVGSLAISYCLCRHYFDKGIPDDPWFKSPGDKGESIQYMPLFREEHWMRRYWFNYFSDTFYLKISSVWDSMLEIIHHFYDLDYPIDFRFRSNILKWLNQNQPAIHAVFDGISSDRRYIDAQSYRTLAAHGTSPSSVTNTVKEQKNVMTEVHAMDERGSLVLDEEGRPVMKQVKAALVISVCAGEYTTVSSIMNNMEEYSTYSGARMQEIIAIMTAR